jgi:hypothetical protein
VPGLVGQTRFFGFVINRLRERHDGLNGLLVATEGDLLAARKAFQARCHRQRAVEPNARQRLEEDSQRLVGDPTNVRRSRNELRALALDVVQLFAEEAQRAVLFTERDNSVLEHSLDGVLDVGGDRSRRDAWLHEGRDVLDRDGEVSQNLEDGDGLADALGEFLAGEADQHPANGVVDGRESATNVFFQRVVQRHRGREPANLALRRGRHGAGPLDEDVLDHLDGGPEAHAAG